MRWLKKWIRDCIWSALDDRKIDILCYRPPTEGDDFCKDSTWEEDKTGEKWVAISRKTDWVKKKDK